MFLYPNVVEGKRRVLGVGLYIQQDIVLCISIELWLLYIQYMSIKLYILYIDITSIELYKLYTKF